MAKKLNYILSGKGKVKKGASGELKGAGKNSNGYGTRGGKNAKSGMKGY